MVYVSTHSVAFVLKVDLIIYSVHFVYTSVPFSLFWCAFSAVQNIEAVTNKQEIKSCNITSTLG